MGTAMIDSEQLLAFTFIFLRISALLIMIPIIGERAVPLRVKGGLAILISLLVFPSVRVDMNSSSCRGGNLYPRHCDDR